MTQAAAALEDEEPLATLLDREFEQRRLARLGSGAAAAVPWRLVRPALYEPLRDFLTRPRKGVRADLLLATYRLTGGKGSPPPELAAFVEALHAGSLIVDDIEDDSEERRGLPALHRTYGVPLALNGANWLYFWAFDLLDRVHMSLEARVAAQRLATSSLRECHYGQALDLATRVDEIEPLEIAPLVRAVSELKTGGLVGLSTGLAALAAGADPALVDAATRFGRDVGVGLQMLDDLSSVTNDRRKHKGHEDLRQGKPTWPWAWLSAHVDARTFSGLRSSLAAVGAGGSSESLLGRMRALLIPVGRQQVREHLDRASARFASALPGHVSVSSLRHELERLENGYGPAA